MLAELADTGPLLLRHGAVRIDLLFILRFLCAGAGLLMSIAGRLRASTDCDRFRARRRGCLLRVIVLDGCNGCAAINGRVNDAVPLVKLISGELCAIAKCG